MMHRFQQNFQDSEMPNADPPQTNQSPGHPVHFIKIRPFALNLISNCDLPVGFCCIFGKNKSGKSFLMNKLLKVEGEGLRINGGNSGTEGIWMWSKPLLNERQGNYVFFLDMQRGFEGDSVNDARIFTLANLISSYLIYNSFGPINQKALNQLNIITQFSKNIVLDDYSDARTNQQNLYKALPKFLWVARDFSVQLPERNDRKMKPLQYLQDVLFEQNNSTKVDQNARKVKRSLIKYYKDRDCVLLCKPISESQSTQNLKQIPQHLLRRDFIEGVNALRSKILKNAGPKRYQQNPLFGGAIASMLESYVNMINNGHPPNVHTAWSQINQDQGAYAYDMALSKFNQLYKQNFYEEKPKGDEIFNLLKNISQASMQEFQQNVSEPNEVYEGKLKKFLSDKEKVIVQVNKQMNEMKNVQILKQCMGPVIKKIQQNGYDGNPEQVNVDIRSASQKFNERAKGENKGEILSEFLATINPIILGLDEKNRKKDNQQDEIERVRREYQMQINNMQNQINSLRNQNNNVDDYRSSNKIKQKNRIKSKGCCSSEGKCQII